MPAGDCDSRIANMSEDAANLLRAARQIIDGEMALSGNFIPRRSAPAAACPTPAASPAQPPEDIDEMKIMDFPKTKVQKAAALEQLREECQKCLKCELGKTRQNLVFGEGNPAAELVFVGEAPGADEDASGRPFVGRAGQKLTEMIQAMGLTREDVYICNVLKCRPPDNRPPASDEIEQCWPYLVRQLQIIRPKVIITLGNPATQNLLKIRDGITKIHGQWRELGDLAPGLAGTPVMPIYHPSYIIRNYTLETRKAVWEDLQQVMERLGLKNKPR